MNEWLCQSPVLAKNGLIIWTGRWVTGLREVLGLGEKEHVGAEEGPESG